MKESDITTIKVALARIQERQISDSKQLEAIGKTITEHAARDESMFEKIDNRMSKVETKQTWLSGASAAIGALIGVGAHKISAG